MKIFIDLSEETNKKGGINNEKNSSLPQLSHSYYGRQS
jgi:hypothetical protein